MWLLAVWICVLALFPEKGRTQIPTICANEGNLTNLVCCPNECGESQGHGRCADIELPTFDFNTTDVRKNWPHYFTRVCECSENYFGVECSRCKYGHFGENCTEKKIIARKSVNDLTAEEWSDYIDVINMTRTHPSGYVVILNESVTGSPVTDLRDDVKLYDFFAWLHHYAAKDNEREEPDRVDYAHESTGFPTWHRQYILWFEWEIQYMLKSMGRSDYHTFRLPYWDWQQQRLRGTDSIFTADKLGSTDESNPSIVTGKLFDSNWTTICWNVDNQGEICDPANKTAQLRRCPTVDGEDVCRYGNPDWPTEQDVKSAVNRKDYDTASFDKYASKSSFRNLMEGFDNDISREDCAENRMCQCGNDSNCTNDEAPLLRTLHNAVHIILGIGYFGSGIDKNEKGVMANVAASANDPIFLNHHAMVDCILEEWLQKHPKPTYPTSDKQPSHQPDAYIVPFFPLVKHRDFFKTADNFGYSCNNIIVKGGLSTGGKVGIGIAVGVVLIAAIIIIAICCKKM